MFHFRRFNLIKHPLTGKQPRVKQIFVFNKHMIKRHLYKSTNVFDKQADTRFFLFAFTSVKGTSEARLPYVENFICSNGSEQPRIDVHIYILSTI